MGKLDHTLTTWSSPTINTSKTLSGLTVGQPMFISTNKSLTVTNAELMGCNISGAAIETKISGVYIVKATSVTLKVTSSTSGNVLIWT